MSHTRGPAPLAGLRLAVFLPCHSGRPGGFGSLIDTVIDCGARSAIGWDESIDTTEANYWTGRFWYYTTKNENDLCVTTAANFAVEDVMAAYEEPWGNIPTMVERSVGTVMITPAGWG